MPILCPFPPSPYCNLSQAIRATRVTSCYTNISQNNIQFFAFKFVKITLPEFNVRDFLDKANFPMTVLWGLLVDDSISV